ncbi:MAG: methyltransferase domain-containing protein [Pseudochelatococcus sp.]|jgi:SAM-dependent methyltransferase|uniref:class I SAM-dependent methyltransferase n=1 Tax=Pseudochelatococcus sp. TaxID=2020869 RepID=UPI003D8D4E40
MSDQPSIDQLLARIREEAKRFALPPQGMPPRRAPLALATAPVDLAGVDARLEAVERRLEADTAALEALRERVRAQASAADLQRQRLAAVDRAEGEIRILRERLRVLGLASPEGGRRAPADRAPADRPRALSPAVEGLVEGLQESGLWAEGRSSLAPRDRLELWPQLLLEDGDVFLNNAYRVLLDRDIDPPGLEGYRHKLVEGRGRLEILCDISSSPEFARRGKDDETLRRQRRIYRWARRIERTPLRFLSRPLYRFLRSNENGMLAVGAARVALAARAAATSLRDRLDRDDALAADPRLDAFHLVLAEAVRGPQEAIRARRSRYLDSLAAVKAVCDGPILDIGAGRGEWLALLRDCGHAARGVDPSPAMVGVCHDKGLDVTRDDALSALGAMPDETLSVISGFDIAERLPFPELFALFGEAFRVLQPGGLLLVETPDPENVLAGGYAFHHDPARRRPLTAVMLDCLARYHGFGEVAFSRFDPDDPSAAVQAEGALAERFNALFYGPREHALFARKPRADETIAERPSA